MWLEPIMATAIDVRPNQAAATVGFAVLAGSAIFLQKLGLAVGGGAVGLDAFILWGVLLWLLLLRRAVIDPLRAVLFLALVCTSLLSVIVGETVGKGLFSAPALIIFFTMYGSFLFRVDVDRAELLRCIGKFQSAMTLIAFVIVGQQVLQYTVGHAYWPNLDRIIPHALLLSGYAYIRPYTWNSPFWTPNGIFFLEPSAASGFLALAFAAEIVWFKRVKRLCLFGVALIAGMAGTGPTDIALFSPLLLVKLDARLRRLALGVGVPLVVIAAAAGAFSHFVARSSEFGHDNSSAYARIVIPFEQTMALIGDPAYVITGNGPGSSPKGNNAVQWPANKLMYEYGLPTAVIFHVFLIVAVLGSAASRTMALIVLIPHLFFGGGFVSHTNIMLLVMFGSLLRLRAARVERTSIGGSHQAYRLRDLVRMPSGKHGYSR